MQAIQTFEDQLGAQFSVNCWALKFSSGPILAAELSNNVQLSLPTHRACWRSMNVSCTAEKKRLSKACAYAKRPPNSSSWFWTTTFTSDIQNWQDPISSNFTVLRNLIPKFYHRQFLRTSFSEVEEQGGPPSELETSTGLDTRCPLHGFGGNHYFHLPVPKALTIHCHDLFYMLPW